VFSSKTLRFWPDWGWWVLTTSRSFPDTVPVSGSGVCSSTHRCPPPEGSIILPAKIVTGRALLSVRRRHWRLDPSTERPACATCHGKELDAWYWTLHRWTERERSGSAGYANWRVPWRHLGKPRCKSLWCHNTLTNSKVHFSGGAKDPLPALTPRNK
jgi:hypothetical protein